ncbi:hypothetical protein SALBM311S_03180 [Streptomyces alboniger]
MLRMRVVSARWRVSGGSVSSASSICANQADNRSIKTVP